MWCCIFVLLLNGEMGSNPTFLLFYRRMNWKCPNIESHNRVYNIERILLYPVLDRCNKIMPGNFLNKSISLYLSH